MCFTKLRLHTEAYRELEAFGDLDNPDLYLEWSPDLNGGRRGSMVPFAFRLLAAVVMMHSGREKEAIERLCATEKIVDKVETVSVNLTKRKNALRTYGHPWFAGTMEDYGQSFEITSGD
jgi:hypothetical protein